MVSGLLKRDDKLMACEFVGVGHSFETFPQVSVEKPVEKVGFEVTSF